MPEDQTEGNTEDTEDIDNFKLKSEQLDSLAIEAQSITPEEKEKYNKIIAKANQAILEEFGKFIDHPIPEAELLKKFIFVDKEDMTTLLEAWEPEKKKGRSYTDRSNISARAYIHEGNFVVQIPDNNDVWNLISEKGQAQLIKTMGDEQKAKDFLKLSLINQTVIHELNHLYQTYKDTTPNSYFLKELQAYWTGVNLVDEDMQIHTSEFDKRADFYQKLVDDYGEEEVHQYALTGECGNYWVKHMVEKALTPQVINELFPEYKEYEMAD